MPPRLPPAAFCSCTSLRGSASNTARSICQSRRQAALPLKAPSSCRTIATSRRLATTASTTPQSSNSRSNQPPSPPPGSTPRSSPTNNSKNDSSSSSDNGSSTPFTTVSPDEVSHFNALASSWWDPHGPSRILHLMNPLRHDFIRRVRASVGDTYHDDHPPSSSSSSSSFSSSSSGNNNNNNKNQGLRYLDIGCGGGIFAESAARLPTTSSVTAIDPTPQVLAIARAHAKRDPLLNPALNPGKLTYINTSIENLPQPTNSTTTSSSPETDSRYDVVTIFEVLEHVNSPAEFLDRCTPFVKPGGWLVMSTIARTWMSWFTTNLMAEDVLGIVPPGTHDWNKYINEFELREHFAGGGGGGGGGGTSTSADWEAARCMGVVYVPGVGWREVAGSEKVGNYFFAVRRTSS